MAASNLLAYIDPGSGTLILQALFAAMVGGFLTIGGIVRRRLGWFARSKTPERHSAE